MLHKATSQEKSLVKTQQKWLINKHVQQKEDQPSSEFAVAKMNFRQSTDASNEKRTGTSMFTTRYSKVLHQSIQLNSEPTQKMHSTVTSQSMPFGTSNSLQYSQQQKKTLSKKIQARIGQFTANQMTEKQFEQSEHTAKSSRIGSLEISHQLEAEMAMREQHEKRALYDFLQKFTGKQESSASGEQDITRQQVASREAPALLNSVHTLSQKTNAPVIRQLPTRLYKGIISSMKRKRLNKLNPTRFGSSGSGAESQRGASMHEEYYGDDNVNCLPSASGESTSPFFGQLNRNSPDILQHHSQYGDDTPVAINALEQMRQNSKLLYTDLSQHHNGKRTTKSPAGQGHHENTEDQSLEDLEERFQQECDDLLGSISADPNHTIPELDSGINSQSWLSSLSKPQDTVYRAQSKESKEEIADKVFGMGDGTDPFSTAGGAGESKLSFTQAWVQQPAQIPIARLFDNKQMTPALHQSLVFNDQLPQGTSSSLVNNHTAPALPSQQQFRSTVQGFNASMQVRNSMRVKGLAPLGEQHQPPSTTLKANITVTAGQSKLMPTVSTGAALSHRRFNSNPYSTSSPSKGGGKALNQNAFQTGSSVGGYTRSSKLPLASNYKTSAGVSQNPFSISITSTSQQLQHQSLQRGNIQTQNQVIGPTSNQLLEYYRRNHETAKKIINHASTSPHGAGAPNTMPVTSRHHQNQFDSSRNNSTRNSQSKQVSTTIKQQQNQFQKLQKKTPTNVVLSQQSYNLSASAGAQSPPSIQ